MSPHSLAACMGREEPLGSSPCIGRARKIPLVSSLSSVRVHLPTPPAHPCSACGVAECHQPLSPAHSPMPQPAHHHGGHSPLLHLLLRDCKRKQEKREKKKRQKFSAFAVTAVLLHFPSVNSLGNTLGLPTMTFLGDVPGLTHSMSCQVFPTWQKLLLRHSLGQPRWSMGPGLQVLGTPKTREAPKVFCVVLRGCRTTDAP